VRQRLVIVRDRLLAERFGAQDGWLAARDGAAYRQRANLLTRLAAITPTVLEAPDAEQVRVELKRLVLDIAHHLQRVNDLVYDDVELELGGED